MVRWFDHWLKDAERVLDEPLVRYFVMGENAWRKRRDMAPAEAAMQRWHLSRGPLGGEQRGGRWGLGPVMASGVAQGDGGVATDTYRYDPRDPVPTIWPLGDRMEALDQRPLQGRADVLVYVSEALGGAADGGGVTRWSRCRRHRARGYRLCARLCDVHPDGSCAAAELWDRAGGHGTGMDGSELGATGRRGGGAVSDSAASGGVLSCRGTGCDWM